MIKQTVLPFKLETTKDLITAHAGLALLGEFAVGVGLNKALDKYLPAPGRGVGIGALFAPGLLGSAHDGPPRPCRPRRATIPNNTQTADIISTPGAIVQRPGDLAGRFSRRISRPG